MRVAFVLADLSRRSEAAGVVVAAASGLLARGHEVAVFTAGFPAPEWPEAGPLTAWIRPIPALEEDAPAAALRAAGAAWRDALRSFDVVHPYGRAALHATQGSARPRLWYCPAFRDSLPVEATHRELLAAQASGLVEAGHPALEALERRRERERGWSLRRLSHVRALAAERHAAAAVEGVLVGSGYAARCFRHAFGRLAEVLEPGVPEAPPPAPLPAPARRGIAVPASSDPDQNLYGVLQVAAELQRRGAPERFEVFGPGTDEPRIQRWTAERGLQAQVALHGALAERQARELLAASRSCLCLPWCEPSGLPALQSLLLATPVLASDHGAPAEIVTRTGGGALVDPFRPTAAADALQAFGSDEAALRALGETGRQAARALFGMEEYLDRLERALRRTSGREPVH